MIWATKRVGWNGSGGVWCVVEENGCVSWELVFPDGETEDLQSRNLADAVSWLFRYCGKDYWDAFAAASDSERWAKRVIRDQDIVLRGAPG